MTENELNRLGSIWRGRIRRAFWRMRDSLRADPRMRASVLAESTEGVGRILEEAAKVPATEITNAYVAAGERAALALGDTLERRFRRRLRKNDDLSINIVFDGQNERAVTEMRTKKLSLVRDISEEQRELLRSILEREVAAGTNPLQSARMFRDSIGLSAHQERMVESYRQSLTAIADESRAARNVLGRALRDKRSDRKLRRLAAAGQRLSAREIDRLTNLYRDRWLKYRFETIARTEQMRAAHAGSDELYRQSIETGAVAADELVQEWHHRSVGIHARGHHASMDGQQRQFGEPFVSGFGTRLRYPLDPNAPGNETIRCRCVKTTVLRSDDEIDEIRAKKQPKRKPPPVKERSPRRQRRQPVRRPRTRPAPAPAPAPEVTREPPRRPAPVAPPAPAPPVALPGGNVTLDSDVNLDRAMREPAMAGWTRDQVEDVFRPPPGHSFDIEDVHGFGEMITIEGSIKDDKTGFRVGGMSRIFKSGKKVKQNTFFLNENAQSKGFGKRYLARQFTVYEQAQVAELDVFAVEVGRYFWAKVGYRPVITDEIMEKFRDWATRTKLSRVEIETLSDMLREHPNDFARLKEPKVDGVPVGKAFFLDDRAPSWKGALAVGGDDWRDAKKILGVE